VEHLKEVGLTTALKTSQQPTTTLPPATSDGFIYGDGNPCAVGDLVESAGNIAEVKRVANNGVVIEIPSSGMQVLDGSALLKYKRLGSTKGSG
jgi:hypothetical protein